jgi:hypothetical protein
MKYCKDCGKGKPLSQFNKHPKTKDGFNNRCKSCQSEYNRAYFERNRDKLLEYKHRWNTSDKGKQAMAREYQKYKVKHFVRLEVKKALASGKLVKPEHCERCNRQVALAGHHNDYSKPLQVEWLCRKCHNSRH